MKTSILVTSCDAFEECWEPLYYSFTKHWPECKYEINIISNFKSIDKLNLNFIKIGHDLGWATNLMNALNIIQDDIIIYMHEDFFLTDNVDNKIIENHLNYFIDNNLDYLRLFPPFFDKYGISRNYAKPPTNKKYFICLQTSIWKKSTLQKLLVQGINAWEFEWNIRKYVKTKLPNINAQVIKSNCYPKSIIPYIEDTAVHKGMWTKNGYKYLMSSGFSEVIPKRKVEGRLITILIHNKIIYLRPITSFVVRFLLKFKINI